RVAVFWPQDTTSDVEGFPQQFLGFVLALLFSKRRGVPIHQRQCIGMVGTEHAAARFQAFAVEAFRISQTFLVVVNTGEYVHGPERIWMLRSQDSTLGLQRLLSQFFGFRVTSFVVQNTG